MMITPSDKNLPPGTGLRNLNQFLLLIVLVFVIMHFGQNFLIPVAISGLFAMMLVPVSRLLEGWGVHRGIAAGICVLVTLFVILGVAYVLINEVVALTKGMSVIGDRLNLLLESTYNFILEHFQYPIDKQREYFQKQIAGLGDSSARYVGGLFVSVLGGFANLLIMTTYTVLFLIYRNRIKRFVLMLVVRYGGREDLDEAKTVVEKITGVASSYLSGVFLVVLILSIVYTLGLTIIGIENALFFGLLAALINVIPYIGSVGGAIIVVIYTLITRDTLTTPIVVAVFFTVIQQIDSYFLTPKITGGMVQLSPLFTIMALLLGAMVWGLAGMIMFIPFMGVLKVIFDHVEELKPYGYLIGEK